MTDKFRKFYGFKLPKQEQDATIGKYIKSYNNDLDKNEDPITKEYLEDWDENEDEEFFWSYKKQCKKKTIGEYVRGHIRNRPDLYMYLTKESFKKKLDKLKEIRKKEGGEIDSDEEEEMEGEGLKRKPGRPKKIIMDSSSSSESEEEKPKRKPGRPKKTINKKCSCGSGLDVEPEYKKFFQALKANTTLK